MKTIIMTLMMTSVATIDAPVAETYAEAVQMRMKIMVGIMKNKITSILAHDIKV
jgi:hypothetical protein